MFKSHRAVAQSRALKPTIEPRAEEFGIIWEKDVDGLPKFKVYAAGLWESAEEYMDVRSPIDLSVVARVPRAGKGLLSRTVRRVHDKGMWDVRDMPGGKRLDVYHRTADLLEGMKDEFAEALVVNAGKTRHAALGEVKASVERLRRSDLDIRKILGEYVPGDWSEETVETEAIVRREPIGIMLAIAPFNYPLFDTVNKVVYSTIVGNAVIVKPASSTPIPSLMFARLLELAGFPKRGLAVLTMLGRDMDPLITDRRISGISLTGSTETGLKVLKTAGIKQFVMELGGGDPAIVLSDADVRDAAQRLVVGMTGYAGQRCDAVKMILAEKVVYPRLKRELINDLKKIRVGDPRNEAVTMGPVINEETADQMMRGVRDAVRRGGKVIFGGERTGRNYVQPTLIEVSKEKVKGMELYRNETFAPVSLIMPIDRIEDGLDIANGRRYGLDASVFGKDVNKIRRLLRMLDVGAVYINDIPRHGIGYFPFGGRKDSGIGREGIGYTFEHVTSHKSLIYSYKGKGVWDYL
jgi:glyceraldehyde-3-phosphate dehydrogenase [NAD(P)+]